MVASDVPVVGSPQPSPTQERKKRSTQTQVQIKQTAAKNCRKHEAPPIPYKTGHGTEKARLSASFIIDRWLEVGKILEVGGWWLGTGVCAWMAHATVLLLPYHHYIPVPCPCHARLESFPTTSLFFTSCHPLSYRALVPPDGWVYWASGENGRVVWCSVLGAPWSWTSWALAWVQ
ncbi:hypothetical protein IAQ61_002838 [Plenodomus lingam]|uniref:uncharacterized protein n=1 Tax=Leptosphaeria maculans TaxID=5022 RepID=UPI00331B8359|nr:hypothetical protein IAQ61_002838 [Plenodomus lingam]